eukprot:scaffold6506_cov171-Amphora_coffeaeformis.AAC.9
MTTFLKAPRFKSALPPVFGMDFDTMPSLIRHRAGCEKDQGSFAQGWQVVFHLMETYIRQKINAPNGIVGFRWPPDLSGHNEVYMM